MRTLLVLVLVALAAPAHAQVVFPADSEFVPLHCGNQVMTDTVGDVATALGAADVVGTPPDNSAAGYRASDATNLYLRIRVEEDPTVGTMFQNFTWGMEFDLDGDRTDYEVLVAATGSASAVQVFANTATTIPNSPSDPGDAPPGSSFGLATNGRAVGATTTNLGGTPDFFVDMAVPWSVLTPLGLDRMTTTYVWVGSSSSPNSLDLDLACHDGASGAPTLDGTASDVTTGDPTLPPPPPPDGTGHLEGGGGCNAEGHSPAWLVLVVLAPLLRRRRR